MKTIPKKLLSYIALVLIALFVLTPLIWAFSASITENSKVFEYAYPFTLRAFFPAEPTLDYYKYLFFEQNFLLALKNTTILSLSTVFFSILISAMAGFAFARFNFRFKNLLFIIILATSMIPLEGIIIPLYTIVKSFGWLYTWQGLIIPGLASGFVIFLFKQFFEEIPQDLIDAAIIDGASWFRIFSRIVLPISKPVLISGALVVFIGTWNSFFWPLIVAPNPELRVVTVAISASSQTEHVTIWPALFGGTVIATIVPLLLIFPFQKYYIRGIATTGIKG
ncbi:L-arabinose transport system permease protein AraQ [subsurface metagenome]